MEPERSRDRAGVESRRSWNGDAGSFLACSGARRRTELVRVGLAAPDNGSSKPH